MTPDDATPLADLALLAVDVETTGLDPTRDQVLSIGFVPVTGDRVELAGARRVVVEHHDPGHAVTVHGLTHDDLASGIPLREALGMLRDALDGRVLLAHHAAFEVAFLRAAYRAAGLEPPDPPAVCTLRLQRRLQRVAGVSAPPPESLRLWRSRARFGLPVVPVHDALGDALACAELYLAQVAELGDGRPLTLRDVRLRHRSSLRRRWRRLTRALRREAV